MESYNSVQIGSHDGLNAWTQGDQDTSVVVALFRKVIPAFIFRRKNL
jgi:hypothetical protein